MTYGELKADFIGQLKHRNVTPSQVEGWISKSIIRIQRLLRTPISEKIIEDTVDAGFSSFPVPNDFQDLISLQVDGRELARTDISVVKAMIRNPLTSHPMYMAREGGEFLVGPLPGEGSKVRIIYSASFSNLTADSDTNTLIRIASDIVIAGAMSYACDYYSDPRGQLFETKFVQGITDLNLKASQDELANAVILPPFSFGCDD